MQHSPDSAGQLDIAFMLMALGLAEQAAADGEVPVGAVVVKDGIVIGRGRNSPIQSSDPSAHAEMQALREAASLVGNYRLEGCTLYVTLEPCAMCSGGILHSRLKRVVYGAADPKTGCAGSVLNLFGEARLNHQTVVEGGLMSDQAGALLQDFFQTKRDQRKAIAVPLREDALRTPDSCFLDLPGFPWKPHYVSDLSSLAGLRLHYVDEGAVDGAAVMLCLHPVPGWSYSYRSQVAGWLEQGARVVMPDLVGFGRSDKPKRCDFHSAEFHTRCMAELIERLDLHDIILVSPQRDYWLALALSALLPDRVKSVGVQSVAMSVDVAAQAEYNAPFPDAGHRAVERAFASLGLR